MVHLIISTEYHHTIHDTPFDQSSSEWLELIAFDSKWTFDSMKPNGDRYNYIIERLRWVKADVNAKSSYNVTRSSGKLILPL